VARAPAVGDPAPGIAKRAVALWVAPLLVAKPSLRARVDEPVGAVGDDAERRSVVAKLRGDLLVGCLALAAAERAVALGRQSDPPGVCGVRGRAVGLGADRLARVGDVLGRPAAPAAALAILSVGDEAARSRLAPGIRAKLVANGLLLAAETLGARKRAPPSLLVAPALLAGGSALGAGLGAAGVTQRVGALCAERPQALAAAILLGDERALALEPRVEAPLRAAVERLARDPPTGRGAVGGV